MGFGSWTITEEKQLLRILHLQKEIRDWNEISKLLKKVNVDRGPIQCYMKWNNNKEKKEYYTCKFDRKNNLWSTFEEKEFLRILQLQKEFPDWNIISKLLKKVNIHKSPTECNEEWNNSKQKKEYYACKFYKKLKNSWSIFEENEFLRILYLQKEYPDWNEISKLLKKINIHRSKKQCYKKQYHSKEKKEYYAFKFNRKKYLWSTFEENEFLRIIKLQKEYPGWKEISKLLKHVNIDKTPSQCYKKWYQNREKKEYYNFEFQKDTRIKLLKIILKLCFAYAPQWQKIANFFEVRDN